MANKIQTNYGSQTSLVFSTTSLASGGVAWTDPAATTSPAPRRVQVNYTFQPNGAPSSTAVVEYYLIRQDGNGSPVYDGADIGTLSAKGSSTTAGDITRFRMTARHVHSQPCTTDASKIYKGSFIIDDPGPGWVLAVYNGSGQAFNAVCTATYREMNDEVQ